MHWPFSRHSRIVPSDHAVSRYLWMIPALYGPLSSDRKIEVAVVVPMNFQRSLGVLDSLRADVLPCAVIDLTAWLFDHSQYRDNPASLLELPTH